ncbi:glycoside hydrolase/deacetylase [Exidia glandulosa HHB12029]|uniref:chitin deacetylase n=1 Tax=Exidia glandulosa HHB12029 TaxID=1314781 RepID=A0A165KVN8_EXIGL|nr:glycoside hydrolase/deacetylase [Exidia glandulosa HHB12029]
MQLIARAVVLALPVVAVVAHRGHAHHDMLAKRQTSSTTVTSTTTAVHAPTPAPTSTTTAPAAGTTPSTPAAPVAPGATDPNAVPLASIVPASIISTQPVATLPATAAGAKPSGLTNAPTLPSLATWAANTGSYPPSDKPPPTNSPEVLQWIQDVKNSGVVIPDIKPFTYGDNMCSIPENAARIGNNTECWWTCGHCERASDITTCKTKGTWGSSFDDGPAPQTGQLLDYLKAHNLKTTFFVVGSRVKDRPEYLQTEYLLGHTIGVHTWSHTSLTTQSTEAIIAEFGWTKKIIKDALGVTPMYIRPPYGDIDDRVRAIARAMNLTPVIWTVGDGVSFDTFDWEVPGGEQTASASVTQFQTILTHAANLATGFIVLEHDLWWQEVDLATGYFLPSALAAHFQITSINQCMNQALSEVYVETSASGKLPSGSGSGGKVTASDQTATSSTPLGGSDGTASGGNGTTGGDSTGDGTGAALREGVPALVGATLLAGLMALAAAL